MTRHRVNLSSFLLTVLWAFFALTQSAWSLDNPAPLLPETAFDYESSSISDESLAVFDTTPAHNPVTDDGATLGRVLFYDRNLSRNRLVRCASCHSQADGFDDPNRFSIGFEGKITRRHAMGLANARYNGSSRYFWDERAATLEDQVIAPIFDQIEMGLSSEELLTRVSGLDYYPPLFKKAFGNRQVTTERISLALAQFVRSIVSQGSRFDQELEKAGSVEVEFAGFSEAENRGKYLFFAPRQSGGAGCSACHQSVAFVMTAAANNGLDKGSTQDRGLGEVTGSKLDDGKFKAASLRNIAVRSPYMHDGRFESLEQVMMHYASGIMAHENLDKRLKDERENPASLISNAADRAALVEFLKTLTDDTLLRDERFSDPFRK